MDYAKEKLKRIPLDVQISKYEEIQTAAKTAGETVNGYIKKAVDERMQREGYTPEPPKRKGRKAKTSADTQDAGHTPRENN
ncbi:MAG: hypothetical protein IJ602_06365 [Paludibacteraceae bacterium]|nr:hypothetical protein [Paludibacteraceae bacterium]